MKRACIILYAIIALAAAQDQNTPQDQATVNETVAATNDGYNGWIQYTMDTWINVNNMDTNCTMYNDAHAPSLCPSGRELYDSACLIKCPEGTTRNGPCNCVSDETGVSDMDCKVYGDPKPLGDPEGPKCNSAGDYLFKSLCYNVECPTNMMRWDACTCIQYTHTKP